MTKTCEACWREENGTDEDNELCPLHEAATKLLEAAVLARQWLGSGRAADDPMDQEVWDRLDKAITEAAGKRE